MTNPAYTAHVIVNFPSEEREWTVEDTTMSLGALEDSISAIIDGNYDATSFVFTITRKH